MCDASSNVCPILCHAKNLRELKDYRSKLELELRKVEGIIEELEKEELTDSS